MKVLTIASVVGIPPVLVAGIYGMNFQKHAGIRLGLGLSIRLGADPGHRAVAAALVQVEGLDINSCPSLRAIAKRSSSAAQSGLLRRGACHRAGHFGPDPLAPRNDEATLRYSAAATGLVPCSSS